EISLGAKGVVELELVSSGERWGRGPKHDIHSSLEAQVDSPSWHLIKALNTLVGPDGHTPAVAGFFDKAKPLTPAQLQMVQDAAATKPPSRNSLESITGCTTPTGLIRWSGSSPNPPSTSKVWSADTRVPAAKPSCHIAPSPRLTCALCQT